MNNSDHQPFEQFLGANDFAPNTIRALRLDFAKFRTWFEGENGEQYNDGRVTPRDISDFRRHLREDRRQAVATVNRCLVTLRRYFKYLVERGVTETNSAEGIKELRRVMGPPKAIERAKVRKILREATVRGDNRGLAILTIMLYCGLRVNEVVALEISDIDLCDRGGSLLVRDSKGGKTRILPTPIEVRRTVKAYLATRPPVKVAKVFIGQGGQPLGTDGVRYLVRKYGVAAGIDLHPHALRHTFATEFLAANQNDLVGLAQLLGHESVKTTSRYAQRTEAALAAATQRLNY